MEGKSLSPEPDVFDFAREALSRISSIAADVGAREKSCTAGCLAAKLWIATRSLESADISRVPRFQKRIPKLIDDLERVCAWPEPANPHHPILQSVLRQGTYQSVHESECRVRRGILAFTNGPAVVRETYFKKLDHFCKRAIEADGEETVPKKNASSIPDAESYPSHVNATLYSVVRAHSICTCTSGHQVGLTRHHGRLRLCSETVKVDGCVAFDMLLSARPNAWDYWQDVQLRVSMKMTAKKSVRYTDAESSMSQQHSSKRLRTIAPGSLCDILKTKLGARLSCQIQGLELHQLYDGSPIVQHVCPGPSISLRHILETHRLSNRMKLVLAYIVARSFWQYYESPWMNSKWTSETIHFLPEPHADGSMTESNEEALYASRPYFAAEFDVPDGIFLEYCDSYSVIYRYPRLLALCTILIEIGSGGIFKWENAGSVEGNLNANWNLAKQWAESRRSWGDFDYPDYRKAILSCLNRQLFDEGTAEDHSQAKSEVDIRKAAIYESIVLPLERLIKVLGFSDNINDIEPIDSRGPRKNSALPLPSTMHKIESIANLIQDREADLSSQWLNRIAEVNSYINDVSRNCKHGQKRRAIRIAVLDTGYDDEAIFFQLSARRRRIKQWKDFYGSSEDPVDENGHGSHTTAILMKIAPNADIYVARVTKDRVSLKQSVTGIAQAIRWAAETCEADIISMSFGFPDDMPLISKTISEVLLLRDNQILFFAAASNSGGNRKEMFPASHDSVISIRETNSNGAFSDTNPPVDPYGPAVFGTLGKHVRSAWLRNIDGELPKSGSSVATAVAAGIAAMILNFANLGFCNPEFLLPAETTKLWTRRGMVGLLAKMSQDMGNRCLFISPLNFFAGRDALTSWMAIADVCTEYR